MQKKSIIYTFVSLLFGVVCAVLRKFQLNTIFDPLTGLAEKGALVTLILAGALVLAAIIFIIMSAGIYRNTNPRPYRSLFSPHSVMGLCIFCICGIAIAAAGIYNQYLYLSSGENTVIISLFSFFAALSGICICVMAVNSFKRKDGAVVKFTTIVPVLFACLLLIRIYMLNAADPVILDYVYSILAVCSTLLALYYNAGFAYDIYKPGRYIFFSEMGVVLCMMSILESEPITLKVFFGGLALFLLTSVQIFAYNLDEKYKNH